MIRLTVLGSSGTYPEPGRACSGYLVEGGGVRLWADAGPGTLVPLMRRTGWSGVDAVWISHLHIDHCADLPVAYHALNFGPGERSGRLPVYGPPGWLDWAAAALSGGKDRPRDLTDVFEPHELADGMIVKVGGLELEAVATVHSVPTFGLRATAGGATLAYSADAGPGPSLERLAARAGLLLCEAAWTEPEPGPAVHCTPADAGLAAERSGARRLVLTHLRPGADLLAATAAASAVYRGPVAAATDGTTYDIFRHEGGASE
jgi:ribonuclease BN (tRNA processing enzyme)